MRFTLKARLKLPQAPKFEGTVFSATLRRSGTLLAAQPPFQTLASNPHVSPSPMAIRGGGCSVGSARWTSSYVSFRPSKRASGAVPAFRVLLIPRLRKTERSRNASGPPPGTATGRSARAAIWSLPVVRRERTSRRYTPPCCRSASGGQGLG